MSRRRGPSPRRRRRSALRAPRATHRTSRLCCPAADPRGIAATIAFGRLRSVALSAPSYTTGRPVTFVQGSPDTPTWERAHGSAVPTALTLDHVMASAALPIVFPAVRIGDEYYGDGSIRQTAPLAPALRLGALPIVDIGFTTPPDGASTAGPRDYPSAAQALGLLFDAVFLDALEADAERVDRVNVLLAALPSGTPAPYGLRTV